MLRRQYKLYFFVIFFFKMGKDGTLIVTKVFWLIGFLIDFVSIVEIKNIKKV